MAGKEKNIAVEIYGNVYKIKPTMTLEYAHVIASYVDKKMKGIADEAHLVSPTKVAILTALNVADELHKDRAKLQELQRNIENIESKIAFLLNSLSEVCA